MDKQVVLVGASWCMACKSMRDGWFSSLEIPGVTFSYKDIEELEGENLTSVPVILFKEGGQTVQSLYGAMGKHDLEHQVYSLWPELKSE
jgi:thiol:disulfide interchange protein